MIMISVLVCCMILAAVYAVEARDMVSSVLALGTVGLCLSLSFLMLQAPDLAAILLIVEIITLTVLIRATVSVAPPGPRGGLARSTEIAVILFLLCFIATAAAAFRALLPFGHDSAVSPALHDMFFSRSIVNRVTAISLAARPLETIGSLVVLVSVAVGISMQGKKARR